MKATQVVQEPFEVKPHWMAKANTCHYCGNDIKKTYGVMVGNKTFCDHMCLADHHLGERNVTMPAVRASH